MKKTILYVCLGALAFSTCGCGSSPSSEDLEIKKLFYYDLSTGIGLDTDFAFSKKNPYVVYIPIEEYKAYVPSFTMSITKSDSKYTFSNLLNHSKAYLDAESGELTYDSFSYFHAGYSTPHIEIVSSLFSPQLVQSESSYLSGEKYIVNLNDYNLKPIKFNSTYYMPIDVLMLIDPLGSKGTAYYNGSFVTLLYSNNKVDYNYDKITSYPSSFYEYCYDYFTLNIDLRYGLVGYSRPMRYNDNQYHKFIDGGSRKVLEKYKKAMVEAKSLEDFDFALDQIFKYEIDDGGHTVIEDTSLATDKTKLDPSFNLHPEHLYLSSVFNAESQARRNASEEQQIYNYIAGFDTDKDGYNDIGYICFDSFSSSGSGSTQDIVKWSNIEFNRNNEDHDEGAEYIKDIVIDLGMNGGGSTACEGLLLAWITGGKAKQVLKDSRDNSVTTTVVKYDFNKDGNYDEGDCIPSDVNVYIISDATYSAATSLVFDTYMYSLSSECKTRGQNIKFIGKPNLGGSCSITGTSLVPTGFEYHMSSASVGVYWDDYSKTVDEIFPITSGWEMSVDQIVDRVGYINPKIVSERTK